MFFFPFFLSSLDESLLQALSTTFKKIKLEIKFKIKSPHRSCIFKLLVWPSVAFLCRWSWTGRVQSSRRPIRVSLVSVHPCYTEASAENDPEFSASGPPAATVTLEWQVVRSPRSPRSFTQSQQEVFTLTESFHVFIVSQHWGREDLTGGFFWHWWSGNWILQEDLNY